MLSLSILNNIKSEAPFNKFNVSNCLEQSLTALIIQIERDANKAVYMTFWYNQTHSLSLTNKTTTIELFPAAQKAAIKDFKFIETSVTTDLQMMKAFLWPAVNIVEMPPTSNNIVFQKQPGSQATQQTSYTDFINLESYPYEDFRITDSDYLSDTRLGPNLTDYIGYGPSPADPLR